jgi:hypothetical protein
VLAAVLVGGCGGASVGRVGAATPVPETRDQILLATGEAIWRRDLGPAAASLTRLAERETGVADPALDYWSDLLALLRCEPLLRIPRAERGARLDNPWDALRRLVQIERVRLARREMTDGPTKRVTSGRTSGKTSEPTARADVRQVAWPVEDEHWSDELPLPGDAEPVPGGGPGRHVRPLVAAHRARGRPGRGRRAGAARRSPGDAAAAGPGRHPGRRAWVRRRRARAARAPGRGNRCALSRGP